MAGQDDIIGYRKRRKVLRDRNLIFDQDVERVSGYLREHVIDPDTSVIIGTFGGNREKRNPKKNKKLKGYILYNDRTRIAAFYDLSNRNLRTFMKVKPKQRDDIILNNNLT